MSSSRSSLPPGFRFHPTDVELLLYYLKRKLLGKSFHFQAIADLDLYKFCPWDLPDKSFLRTRDLEWFFFCPRDRKYTNGPRTNRTTDIGYWKTTGRDRPISHDSHIVGFKKTLVFHIGRAPHGERTNWVMHEYRLQDNNLSDAGVLLDAYVLSKIFEKSGAGPKNGEQHGAPFKEEDWEEDVVDDNSLAPWAPSDTGSAPPLTVGDNANSITESSSRDLPNKCGSSLEPPRRDVSSDTGSAPNKSGPSLELPHRDASSDIASAPSHTVGCNNNTITECSMLDLPNKCGSSLEHPRQDASSDAIVGNLQLSEDLDMETLLACFGDVDELSGSRKDSKKELDSSYCQSNVESSARVDGNDIFSGLEDICPGAELKATVTSYLPNMWEKCVLDQSPLGGDVNYLELNDLDGFMGYPTGGTGCMQTEVDIPRSELEAVDNLCFPNRVDTTSYTELNDSETLLKCPMEANENEKLPYMYRYEPYFGSDTVRPAYGVGSSSKHPKLSDTVRPAYGVGSSSKHPKLSGVFHDNLFMSSDDNNGNGFNCSMGI